MKGAQKVGCASCGVPLSISASIGLAHGFRAAHGLVRRESLSIAPVMSFTVASEFSDGDLAG